MVVCAFSTIVDVNQTLSTDTRLLEALRNDLFAHTDTSCPLLKVNESGLPLRLLPVIPFTSTFLGEVNEVNETAR